MTLGLVSLTKTLFFNTSIFTNIFKAMERYGATDIETKAVKKNKREMLIVVFFNQKGDIFRLEIHLL